MCYNSLLKYYPILYSVIPLPLLYAWYVRIGFISGKIVVGTVEAGLKKRKSAPSI